MMPNWEEIAEEIKIQGSQSPSDRVRRKYLKLLSEKTGRNVIAYYSGWLQKTNFPEITAIVDDDKNGFMATIHGLDRSKGLDLILHTPGGNAAATESIVDYLHKMFNKNIRAIIPQLAMSAGTMIACASKEIIMGKHSNLGPIDPQFGGIPAYGVVEEFNRAKEEVKKDASLIPIWQTIISKYNPAFIGECEKAIEWSKVMVAEWLESTMFENDPKAVEKAKKIVGELSDHSQMKTHSRHISKEQCESLGLKILSLEADQSLQDLVLTVHHAYMHTFNQTAAVKIIENSEGHATVQQVQVIVR